MCVFGIINAGGLRPLGLPDSRCVNVSCACCTLQRDCAPDGQARNHYPAKHPNNVSLPANTPTTLPSNTPQRRLITSKHPKREILVRPSQGPIAILVHPNSEIGTPQQRLITSKHPNNVYPTALPNLFCVLALCMKWLGEECSWVS